MAPLFANPAKSKDFDLAPAGEVWAVLQKVTAKPNDKDGNPAVLFTWEACNSVDKEGRPFKYFDSFINRLEGRLAKMIEALTGSKPDPKSTTYDLHDLLGIKAQLTIKHNKVGQKTYANITEYYRSEITDEDIDAANLPDANRDEPLTDEDVRQYFN